MKAVEIREPGGPEVLAITERPVPAPGPGEVVIRVAAAGVNRPDVMQRQGRYPPPPGTTDIPGLEVSGVIEAAEGDVGDWRIGDEVCALVSGGGYAEYCVAPAPQCLPVPRGMALPDAAGIPEAAFTVWTNVFDRGRLARGESLLVHGGSSGIGTTAIQLARASGARVFATAGSAAKCAACEDLGAEQAINYHDTDFVVAIAEATAGRGVDVVLDMVGGEYVGRNLNALAVDGRLVLIAWQGGMRATIDLLPILRKRLTVTGSTLRARTIAEKGALARAVRERVWPIYESGAARVVVHQVFDLDAAAAAHRLMEAGGHIGKLLLQVES